MEVTKSVLEWREGDPITEIQLHVQRAQYRVGHINSPQEKSALYIEKQLNRWCRTVFNDDLVGFAIVNSGDANQCSATGRIRNLDRAKETIRSDGRCGRRLHCF